MAARCVWGQEDPRLGRGERTGGLAAVAGIARRVKERDEGGAVEVYRAWDATRLARWGDYGADEGSWWGLGAGSVKESLIGLIDGCGMG